MMTPLLSRRDFLHRAHLGIGAGLFSVLPWNARAVEPIPDRLVVLTFDDSVASHATFVAPLLKKHGFGATFFITEGFETRRLHRHPDAGSGQIPEVTPSHQNNPPPTPMKSRSLPLLLASLSIAIVASTCPAEDKPKPPEPPAYTTPETAGPDFALQGEYEGRTDNGPLGADVIALGNGTFRVVFHRGGLPGAGWDGSAKKEIEGTREGDTVAFKDGWEAVLGKAGLSGRTDKGADFDLQRVERHSPTEGAKAPGGAVILFDGSKVDAWHNARMDQRQLLAPGGKTKEAFQSFDLHLEFLLPFKPQGRGQGRGNSGVYLQDRYELQVLDSFGLKGVDNECGGIYHNISPKVNMCYPPLQWQTYDIEFTAAKFDDTGKKTKSAIVTVKHNGTIVQDHLELQSATPGGGFENEVPAPGPIQLQNHDNPVFYRNIWLIRK